jgi:hypothetical protein
MFVNLLLPNYPLLQIKNNIIAAANRRSGEPPISAQLLRQSKDTDIIFKKRIDIYGNK